MTTFLALLAILGALSLGVVSPGPSFVLVARTSIALSRSDGVAAAFGMGAGGVLFGALALLGLQALLATVGWLYAGLKLAGGAYLVWIGLSLWRGAARPLAVAPAAANGPGRWRRSFAVGLGTQISNPKAAVIYGSVFAALLPPHPSPWLFLILPPLIFVLETSWYVLVAVVFSSGRPRALYLRAKAWIDRAAGTVMALLGLRLMVEAGRA